MPRIKIIWRVPVLLLRPNPSGDVSYVEIEFVDANNNSSPNHVCKGCNKHFANKSNLARHSKIHTGNMLECNVCTKAYPTYYDLKRHTESVHGCRRFVCEHDDCNKVFKSAVGLSNHNKEHQGQFSYLCQYCGKGFSYKTDYKEHILKHEEKKLSPVVNVENVFTSKKTGKEVFCNVVTSKGHFRVISGKKLRCERYLKEHLNGHSNPDQYQCATCGNFYKYWASLFKHRKKTGHK